jgi:hypothetical protein
MHRDLHERVLKIDQEEEVYAGGARDPIMQIKVEQEVEKMN